MGLPATDREARLEEIESDIWEEVAFARSEGAPPGLIALQIYTRLLFGVPMDLSWRLSGRGGEREALGRGAKSLRRKGGGALRFAFKSRLAVGTMLATGALFLTAGSVTAIRDQITVGDRVDNSLIGSGLAELETIPYDSTLPRIELTVFVPHMAVKARAGRGDTVTRLSDDRVLVVGNVSSPETGTARESTVPSRVSGNLRLILPTSVDGTHRRCCMMGGCS